MYSLSAYGAMLDDQTRMEAYEAAIRRVVQPGTVVVDIGAGTGIMSLLACRAGARRVYAIEFSDSINVGRQIASANGFGERITFLQARSTDVTLPERADVLLSDLRGVLPLYQQHIPSIVDARRRHLHRDAVVVGEHDQIFVALVESAADYESLMGPWQENRFGFDMSAASRLVANSWCRSATNRIQLLSEPAVWTTLDYRQIESPNVQGSVGLTVTQPGTAHGVLVWFGAELTPGIRYSSAPGQGPTVYGRAFFPFLSKMGVEPGERIEISLRADLIADEYVWSWQTMTPAAQPGVARTILQQTTFAAEPASLQDLKKRALDHVPVRREESFVDEAILQAMDGQRSVNVITDHIMSLFPNRFQARRDALRRVTELSAQYSR